MDDTSTISSPIPKIVPAFSRFGEALRHQIKGHALLCFSCIGFFIVARIILASLGQPMGFSFWPYLEMILVIILPIAFFVSLILRFLYIALIKRSHTPSIDLINHYRTLLGETNRWAKSIPAIGVMMLGFIAFTDMKGVIPLLNAYSWDESFMLIDKALHFGQHPWQILQPFIGSQTPTIIINFFYNLWFFIMFGFWLYAGTTKIDQGWERQFLLSFIWSWIIGGWVLATFFSSMGPAYYDLISPASNPYLMQMEMLRSINESHTVLALGTQDVLRESYLGAEGISGISAMPSMHNTTSTLFMLAAFRIHKYFGLIMALFLGFIVIGSVHLAWHYAVDAYAGVGIALLIWWISGKALKWQDQRTGYKA